MKETKKTHATFWDRKKIMQPLRTKKVTQPIKTKKITQPLRTKKIMQLLGTKKITQPLGTKNVLKIKFLVTHKIQEIGTDHLGLVSFKNKFEELSKTI